MSITRILYYKASFQNKRNYGFYSSNGLSIEYGVEI